MRPNLGPLIQFNWFIDDLVHLSISTFLVICKKSDSRVSTACIIQFSSWYVVPRSAWTNNTKEKKEEELIGRSNL